MGEQKGIWDDRGGHLGGTGTSWFTKRPDAEKIEPQKLHKFGANNVDDKIKEAAGGRGGWVQNKMIKNHEIYFKLSR